MPNLIIVHFVCVRIETGNHAEKERLTLDKKGNRQLSNINMHCCDTTLCLTKVADYVKYLHQKKIYIFFNLLPKSYKQNFCIHSEMYQTAIQIQGTT